MAPPCAPLATLALDHFGGPQALPELPMFETLALIKVGDLSAQSSVRYGLSKKIASTANLEFSPELCRDRRSTDRSIDGFQKPQRRPDSAKTSSKFGLSFLTAFLRPVHSPSITAC